MGEHKIALSRRQFIRLAAGSVAASALVGCSAPAPQAEESKAEAPAAAEPTSIPAAEEVAVAYWSLEGDNDNNNLVRGVIDPFKEQHPDIKLNWEEVPWDPYYEKYQTLSAAGQAPDIAFASAGWIHDFIHLGLVLNLDPYIQKAGLFKPEDADKYFLNVLDGLRFPRGGSLYAIPYEWVTYVFYYNKDIFDAAGEPYPTKDWTYDKLLEVAQRLTKRSGDTVEQYGFVSHWGLIDSSLHANGGDLVNDDFTQTMLNTPQNVETIQWWVDLVQKHKIAPLPTSFPNDDPGLFFAGGNVAMILFGVWVISDLRSQDKFKWDITLLPKGTAKQTAVQWGNQYAINAKSKHPEEAFKLAMVALSPDRPADTMGVGKVPMGKAQAYSDIWLEKGLPPENKQAILEIGDLATPLQTGIRYDEWRSIMDQELQLSFLGERPVQESVDVAAKAIQAVLDRP